MPERQNKSSRARTSQQVLELRDDASRLLGAPNVSSQFHSTTTLSPVSNQESVVNAMQIDNSNQTLYVLEDPVSNIGVPGSGASVSW